MTTTRATKTIPAEQLTPGMRFIPAGKKRPVEIERIWKGISGKYEIAGSSSQGWSAHLIPLNGTAQVVA
jgi:hypothetical protein